MTNQKGFATVIGLLIVLIIIMALLSVISKPTSNNIDQQYQDPTIQVDIAPTNQNTQYQMTSVQTTCNYMGGSWYQNTYTCAGNIDVQKCSLYGGRVNQCDSSCRYAGSRICYTTCETTCVFNTPNITYPR